MRIEHVALWVADLEQARRWWETYFGASSNDEYVNAAGFHSYFLTFPDGGSRLELMYDGTQAPNTEDRTHDGYGHVAISVGVGRSGGSSDGVPRRRWFPLRERAAHHRRRLLRELRPRLRRQSRGNYRVGARRKAVPRHASQRPAELTRQALKEGVVHVGRRKEARAIPSFYVPPHVESFSQAKCHIFETFLDDK